MKLRAHSYDIEMVDGVLSDDGVERTEIRLWCIDYDSNPVLCRIKDAPIFCKVELPPLTDRRGFPAKWDRNSAKRVFSAICRKADSSDINGPSRFDLVENFRLYYYSERKYPYLLLRFDNIKDMFDTSRRCKTLYVDGKKMVFEYREIKIAAYNKILSLKDMGPTEKFLCEVKEIENGDIDRISKPGTKERPARECFLDWKKLEKDPDPEWISDPMTLSFDIESYSHKWRSFPQRLSVLDIVFSISCAFKWKEKTWNYVVIMGPCQKVDDCEIIYAQDEDEVILKFCELVNKHDPDVITGYNIFGFDYDYLDNRILPVLGKWPNISRLLKYNCYIDSQNWNSSAYGDMNLSWLKCPGRISIDLLPWVKREYKLMRYNLSTVGKHFLGEDKVDLKAHEMFKIHHDIMETMDKIKEMTGLDDDKEALAKAKDVLDKKELKELKKRIKLNTLVVKYNIQDSILVLKLMEVLNLWASLIELSNIVRVTPLEYFTRGQQIRCLAQLYHRTSHMDYVMNTREKSNIWSSGGKVANPIPGFWPLSICFDFNSLYPSIMIAYNMCYTTLLRSTQGLEEDKDYVKIHVVQEEPKDKKAKKDDEYDYGDLYEMDKTTADDDEEEEDEEKKTITREYNHHFVTKDRREGILPLILKTLLANRKIAKGHKKKVDIAINSMDPKTPEEYEELRKLKTRYIIHDSRQLGLKISANSVYGFLKAQALPLEEASQCVTQKGRDLITLSERYCAEHYGATTVYGDSVVGDEPLLLRDENGLIDIKTIETLGDEWMSYEGFKVGQSNRREKQQSSTKMQVWTADGWANIKRVIRHKTQKKIFKVNTYSGCVEVTEDHSLMDSGRNKLKPEDCGDDTELYHNFPLDFPSDSIHLEEYGVPEQPEFVQECSTCNETKFSTEFYMNKKTGDIRKSCKLCQKKRICERTGAVFDGVLKREMENVYSPSRLVNEKEAWVFGFFFGDGSCGDYTCESGRKRSWALNNTNLDYLKKGKEYLESVEPSGVSFKIIDTIDSSGVYKLVPVGDAKYMVQKYRKLFYDNDKYKKVPKIILNSPLKVRKSFFDGYYAADGCKGDGYSPERPRFCCKGKIGAQGLYYICKSIGIKNITVNIRSDKDNIYSIKSVKDKYYEDRSTKIRKIFENEEKTKTIDSKFVYDLETERGNFNAGVGSMSVFNTDSIMVYLPYLNDDPSLATAEAQRIEADINGYPDKYDDEGKLVKKGKESIFPPPLYLEAEKNMRSFFIRKKFYAYYEYDKKGNIIKEKGSDVYALNAKGSVISRRDGSPWNRKMYEVLTRGILRPDEEGGTLSYVETMQIIIDNIKDLLLNRVDIFEELKLVVKMGSNYKSKSNANYVFSELMKKLGRPIAPGERFPFLVVHDHQGRDKKGYKMREIDMFKEQWEAAGVEYGEPVPEDYKPEDDFFPPENVDLGYYLKGCMNNIDTLIEKRFCVPQNNAVEKGRILIEPFADIEYVPKINTRLHKVGIEKTMKMIMQIVKDHKDRNLVEILPELDALMEELKRRESGEMKTIVEFDD